MYIIMYIYIYKQRISYIKFAVQLKGFPITIYNQNTYRVKKLHTFTFVLAICWWSMLKSIIYT